MDVRTTSLTTHQTKILTWKRNDHFALAAFWDSVENSIFSHVGAYKVANKAWLALENTYFASDIITHVKAYKIINEVWLALENTYLEVI